MKIPQDLYDFITTMAATFEGCDCDCIPAHQEKDGYWMEKHECVPCHVKRMREKYTPEFPSTRRNWCASLDYGESPPKIDMRTVVKPNLDTPL